MKGSRGASGSQQISPLQPSHLSLSNQPDGDAQRDAPAPRLNALDSRVSQPASSQHSLKGCKQLTLALQASPDIAEAGHAADAEKATISPDDARLQSSQRAGHKAAGVEDGDADGPSAEARVER